MNDDLFNYLLATDTLDEFLGYKGLKEDEDIEVYEDNIEDNLNKQDDVIEQDE